MTFLSTTVAFGTFPFWIWFLGRNYMDFDSLHFPWWNMLLSLITLFLPASAGFLLRRYRPVIAHRIGRYLHPIAVGQSPSLLSLFLFDVSLPILLGYLVFLLTFGGKDSFSFHLEIFHWNSFFSLYQHVYFLHHRL